MRLQKRAVALLITLFFIMIISVSLGLSLRYMKDIQQNEKESVALIQNDILIRDIINILHNLQLFDNITSSEDLAIFFDTGSMLYLEENDFSIYLQFSSARSKLPVTVLKEEKPFDIFLSFLQRKQINELFGYLLKDIIGGEKEDNSYETNLFQRYPMLYKNGLVEKKQLFILKRFYKSELHDNGVEKFNFSKLFYIGKVDNTYKIDLNYASVEAWEYILGVSKERAEQIVKDTKIKNKLEDFTILTSEERQRVEIFTHSFFEPVIEVEVLINNNGLQSKIRFEYNFKTKKESNFVFES
ncbi:MAG: hypothetical protein GXO30_07400 [Epsilonproteobacteria bacterium]|nr:hypothetical protein [Campylobacterota bacterium]